MAKKKVAVNAAPEANQQGEGQSKIAIGVELIGEWEAKGKNTRSSQELLAELQSRYPGRDWKIADVTNAKSKIREKAGKGNGNGRKKASATKAPKPTPASPRAEPGGAVTASDLLVVKKALGSGGVGSLAASVEQVGKLAEQVGGFDKLREAVQALSAILATE